MKLPFNQLKSRWAEFSKINSHHLENASKIFVQREFSNKNYFQTIFYFIDKKGVVSAYVYESSMNFQKNIVHSIPKIVPLLCNKNLTMIQGPYALTEDGQVYYRPNNSKTNFIRLTFTLCNKEQKISSILSNGFFLTTEGLLCKNNIVCGKSEFTKIFKGSKVVFLQKYGSLTFFITEEGRVYKATDDPTNSVDIESLHHIHAVKIVFGKTKSLILSIEGYVYLWNSSDSNKVLEINHDFLFVNVLAYRFPDTLVVIDKKHRKYIVSDDDCSLKPTNRLDHEFSIDLPEVIEIVKESSFNEEIKVIHNDSFDSPNSNEADRKRSFDKAFNKKVE